MSAFFSGVKMNQIQPDYNAVSLQKVDLKHLDPHVTNVLIVGIIIGKNRPKILETQQRGPDTGGQRAVWNFTIRDSVPHYINVAYWGNPEQIFQANDKFSTGDVVEIINPQVQIRKLDDKFEQWHPMVTSPYKLTLSDKSAIVNHHNPEPFLRLLHCPTKPTAMFVPIHDIHNRGGSIEFADILGAVKGVNQIRSIKSRTGEMLQVREIELFDHTAPTLKVSLWEPDLINRSNSWKPRSTILFMTDLKIDWSNFGRAYMGKATTRTIVTENPASKEAKALFEYAQNAPIETFDLIEQMVTSIPSSSSSIDEIMSIRQVHDRINSCNEIKEGGKKSFTVILYAFVTKLDLDGLSPILIVKCGHCKMPIKNVRCENSECPVVFENETVEPDMAFDIRVSFSDHTGTLTNCRLTGQAAENALGYIVKDFRSMPDDEKASLKWKYLLEQCKVRLAIIFSISQYPIISVLEIARANPIEVASKLPVY
ncbi:unnamed protein product [Ceutorhynchus assimilis]|uniref:MEIOB-like N-terminal domain-containing protein n=1 Tax=Ceutorhynchus assimilis TaxID=467358 RepID=A0A9N9MVE1_9CUCU|nr:unnamed protein product [Ceutorhynchus assimilis]